MEQIFLSVLNMSLTASFVIVAICLARLLLKRAPKVISYALWAVVGFRLLFPWSLESVFSLFPFITALIPSDIAWPAVPLIDSGILSVDNAVSGFILAPALNNPAVFILEPALNNPAIQTQIIWTEIASYIWITGVAVMFIYSIVSIMLLKRRLYVATFVEGNLYETENLKTPFVIGLIRPKIYVPAELSKDERRYIVLHEQTHIQRRDHVVKVIAHLALSLHWFNPLAWVAFVLMSADMEMSCDERIMKELGTDIKNDYSLSLVSMAVGRRILNSSPLAFGEGGMKERVKNVLKFRTPSRVILVVAVIFAVLFGAGFAINPVSNFGDRVGFEIIEIEMFEEYDGDDKYLKIILNMEYENTSRINQIDFWCMNNRINSLQDAIILDYEKKDRNTVYIEIDMLTNDTDSLVMFLKEDECFLEINWGKIHSYISHVKIDFNKNCTYSLPTNNTDYAGNSSYSPILTDSNDERIQRMSLQRNIELELAHQLTFFEWINDANVKIVFPDENYPDNRPTAAIWLVTNQTPDINQAAYAAQLVSHGVENLSMEDIEISDHNGNTLYNVYIGIGECDIGNETDSAINQIIFGNSIATQVVSDDHFYIGSWGVINMDFLTEDKYPTGTFRSLEKAREAAPFPIREPAYLPENLIGLRNVGVWRTGTNGHDTMHFVELNYDVAFGHEGGISILCLKQAYAGADGYWFIENVSPIEKVMVGDSEAVLVSTNAKDWEPTNDKGYKLYWIKDGIAFELSIDSWHDGYTPETMIKIAKSIHW